MNAYTDWIPVFDANIKNKKDKVILEFGIGAGTKYLIDTFKEVYSFEFIPKDNITALHWYNVTVEQNKENKNWSFELQHFEDFNFTDIMGMLGDKSILPETLLSYIDGLIEKTNPNVIFMDGGFHTGRGLILNYILNKYNIETLIIHDAKDVKAYGYDLIEDVNNKYSNITYTIGQHTKIYSLINK